MRTARRCVTIVLLQIVLFLFLVQSCGAQSLLWKYPTGTDVMAVSTSADGSYIVSGNTDGSIDFFDTAFSHRTYLWRTVVRDQVRSVAVSDDGSFVAAGGNDGVVYFVDRQFAKRSPLWKFQTAGTVFSVAISGNGSYITAGSYDHRVYFMDNGLSGDAPLWSHQTGGNVRSVAISGDGSFLAAGSEDQYLYFFEKSYRGNTFLWRFEMSAPPLTVAISDDGNYVVTGCSDGYVYFADRNFSRNSYLWRYQTDNRISSISISHDGSYVVAGSLDGYLYLFDKGFSNNSYLWKYQTKKTVEAVAVSKNGVYLVCAAGTSAYLFDASFSGQTYIWSYDAGTKVTSVSISNSGQLVVVGDEGGFVHALRNLEASTHLFTTTEMNTSTSGTITSTPFINLYMVAIILMIAVLVFLGIYLRKTGAGEHIEVRKPRLVFASARKEHLPLVSERMMSTGIRVLDELMMGGFPYSYSIVLLSPSCDQRDQVVQSFLRQGVGDQKSTLCLTTDVTKYLDLIESYPEPFHLVLCNPQADELAPSLPNVSKTKGVENLTEINIALMKIVESLAPQKLEEGRFYIDILSDVLLLQGKATTRRWISELVPRLKARGFTVLGMINPSMHNKEETEAITSIFDGEIEIFEKEVEGKIRKFIAVRRLYDRSYIEEERVI